MRVCCRSFALISVFRIILATIFVAGNAFATEDIEITKDFRISRDFRAFTIKQSSKIFFDASKFVIYDGPAIATDERMKIEARSLLEQALTLVSTKSESQFFIEVRMGEFVNYAIRNADKDPSTGFVIVSACSYPLNNMVEDCQNLTFYFFRKGPRSVILARALNMWLDRMVVP